MNALPMRALALLAATLLLAGCHKYISPDARDAFEAREEAFTVTVYPVNVVRPPGTIQPDSQLAEKLVAFLDAERLAVPVLAQEPVLYDFEFSPNQAKIVAHSAKAFAARVAEAGIKTDYALVVEIMLMSDGAPGGVHYYLSDPQGRLADGAFTNDHWDEFKAVQPRTAEDGCEVAILMLRRTWGE